ncbi:TonB-dependent receptor [Methyloversatilis thermotolerans]|uniref:TonB-dependent receptor n=1 Tax=Methyloversatilis thermotolerans TaxID=1346290 RepID=UPI0038CC1BCE
MRGNALRDRRGSTVGETVGDEAGVHNTTFGAGVGLPVIRGLSGTRVKVLSNGGATHDASTFSPDHASTADATLAESIRVLRGPAILRYGGGALGGAIDVDDGRIPLRPPSRPVSGTASSSYGSNGRERVNALKLDTGGGPVALRASGFARDRSDSHIAGCAVDDAAVFQQFGQINTRNSCGRLYNSDARSAGGTLGGTVFIGDALFGAAVNNSSNNYGIPPAPGHSHGGDDRTRIDMDNRRVDTRAEWLGEGWLQTLRYTGAHIEYRHDEIDDGTIATTFRNKAIEQRLEAEHALGENFAGTVGVHHVQRRFSAVGLESFIPRTELRSSAVYVTQRMNWRSLTLEAGARAELTRMQAGERELATTVVDLPDRKFNANSRTLAAYWRMTPSLRIGTVLSHAQRAPEIHELYSLGPHLATRTYDVGNLDLGSETLHGREWLIEYDDSTWRARINLFVNRFDDFIYQRTVPNFFYDTDEERIRPACVRLEECLPVTNFSQSDARLHGFEAEIARGWDSQGWGRVELSLFADEVKGRLTRLREDVPRLPPLRFGSELSFRHESWTGRLRLTRYADQDRPGTGETTTDGYTRLDANLSHRRALGEQRMLTLSLRARNLLDADARNATSLLRNFSPEPGRSIEVAASLEF